MGEAAAKLYLSVEDYLEGEQHWDIRHEYFDGTVTAMAGATVRHNSAAGWMYRQIAGALAGRSCNAFIGDVKIRTKAREKDLFYYSDVMVYCDPTDRRPLYREHPKLVVEVLSTDENKDLVEKYFVYRHIDSIEEYVTIRPDPEPGKFEVFRHLKGEGWNPGERYEGGILKLASVDLELHLDALRAEIEPF